MSVPAPSNQNHTKLSRLNMGLGIAYAILFGSLQLFHWSTLTESGKLAVNVLSIFMPLLHFGLAWGCKNKSEISRRISQIIGFIMLLWLPIGPFFGFFFIRFADWKSLPEQKAYVELATNTQITLRKIGIEHTTLQKVGTSLFLISPLALAIILADAGFGFHIISSNMVLLGHWLAIGGLLTLTPIGFVLFFIGRWLKSRKVHENI